MKNIAIGTIKEWTYINNLAVLLKKDTSQYFTLQLVSSGRECYAETFMLTLRSWKENGLSKLKSPEFDSFWFHHPLTVRPWTNHLSLQKILLDLFLDLINHLLYLHTYKYDFKHTLNITFLYTLLNMCWALGWYGRLNVQLLVLALVMTLGLWDQTWHWAPYSAWSLLQILSPFALPAHTHALCLINQ